MKFLPVVSLFLLSWSGTTFADQDGGTLKDRSKENIPELYIRALDETKDWALLQCEARGSPQPKVEWKNSSGNVLSAIEPQFPERGGSSVTLNITVTKTGRYRCVATQKTINYQISAETVVHLNGPVVVVVVVGEGNDVILPCSLSTKEDIELKAFTWITDGQKQVFSYNAGIHSNNGRPGQVEQFKGRVSYFRDELKNGDASIKITNTMAADSGSYSCVFPHLQSETRHIQLVVRPLVEVKVVEGSDVILPCSLSPAENIESNLFDWKKDGRKEVFMYDAGLHYNNGRPGQDEQFKGGVSHFPDELKYGIASIKITKTKLSDSGNYTCVFPRLQPERRFLIQLVVGAAPEPSVTILAETKGWALLQCKVRGASPEPKVEWKDSSGNIVPAEEPQVSKRGDSYNVILQAMVTKTDRYSCVSTQEEINHQIHAEIYVFINGSTEWIVAAVFIFLFVVLVAVVVLAVLYCMGVIKLNCCKGSPQNEKDQTAGNELKPLKPSNETV